MVLSIALILTILLSVLAFRTKCLHKLEVVVLWMFISSLVNDVYSMGGLNLGHIKTSDRMEEFFTFVVFSAAFIPAFITWMLGIISSLRTPIWKYVFIVLIPFVLFVLEYTADFVGIIEHHHMSKGDSFLVWILVLLVVYIFRRWFFSLSKGV